MAEISPNTRLRVSPYYEATVAEGVTAFSPYNRMLMPVSYGDPSAEYTRLTQGVAQWDVAVERQVEITGPDAARLTQILSVRDLSGMVVGKGRYIPMCDHRGVLINDPVVLKHADDHFWLSIGDNNILMWARAIAAERGLDVQLQEPDVSPMALQGPKAEDVMAAVFGDWVRDLRHFHFADAELKGMRLIVQRSGYSKQGGFEIYLRDGARGVELWNIIREAGKPWGIGPGGPNPPERIEGGMLSFGGDTDDTTNPFEVNLGKYVDLDLPDEVIGIRALRDIKARGITRHLIGIVLDAKAPEPGHLVWYEVQQDGRTVGTMMNGTYSPKLQSMIGFALLEVAVTDGAEVQVLRGMGATDGKVCSLPFV